MYLPRTPPAVLDEISYREAAGRIARAIAEEPAEDRVVAEVESLVGERSLISP